MVHWRSSLSERDHGPCPFVWGYLHVVPLDPLDHGRFCLHHRDLCSHYGR